MRGRDAAGAGVPSRSAWASTPARWSSRSIGNDLRMEYYAVGQTTHLAARMEQMAKPASVLLTGGHAAPGGGLRSGAGARARGGAAAWPRPSRCSSWPAPRRSGRASRSPPCAGSRRLVGRQAELAPLQQALDQAPNRRGPGRGPRRRGRRREIAPRLGGHALPSDARLAGPRGERRLHGKASDLAAHRRPAPGLFPRGGRERRRARSAEKLIGKLIALDETLRPTLRRLRGAAGGPGRGPGVGRRSTPPSASSRRSRPSSGSCCGRARCQPLLLVLEDLHWIDGSTQALLDSLVETLPAARMLLLVNYRPEYRHGWGAKAYYSQLRLDPLSPETAE